VARGPSIKKQETGRVHGQFFLGDLLGLRWKPPGRRGGQNSQFRPNGNFFWRRAIPKEFSFRQWGEGELWEAGGKEWVTWARLNPDGTDFQSPTVFMTGQYHDVGTLVRT